MCVRMNRLFLESISWPFVTHLPPTFTHLILWNIDRTVLPTTYFLKRKETYRKVLRVTRKTVIRGWEGSDMFRRIRKGEYDYMNSKILIYTLRKNTGWVELLKISRILFFIVSYITILLPHYHINFFQIF